MIRIPEGTKALTTESRLNINDVIYQPDGGTGQQLIQLVRLNVNEAQLVFIYSVNKELWSSAFHRVNYIGARGYRLGDLRNFTGYDAPMYLVKLSYMSDAVVLQVKTPSDYLRSGALFVGAKNKTAVAELFRLNVKDETPVKGILYTFARMSDDTIRSFYIPEFVKDNKAFTNFITTHSDEFSSYTFKRLKDTKEKGN